MKRLLLSAWFLILGYTIIPAQMLRGTIVDEKGEPLQAVSVVLLDKGYHPLQFTQTDVKGNYSLTSQKGEPAFLRFSCVGFESDTVAIREQESTGNHVMHRKTLKIKEVVVKSSKVYEHGDTLDYLVKQFSRPQDRTIADVIKNMPGLAVKDDKTIEYQGQAISKFYIEGLDMLGEKYRLASENIKARKVKKVQVLEHHQPIKMMRGVNFSSQAALNIVLEEDAKEQWRLDAELAAGSALQDKCKALGEARTMAMLFAHRKQSLSLYKFNNTGKDIAQEIDAKDYLRKGVPTERGYVPSLNTPTIPIDQEKYRFNTSHLFASNWLFKTARSNDLRLQVSGLIDDTHHNYYTSTTYTDVLTNNTIIENTHVKSYRAEIEAKARYEINHDKLYLSNILHGLINLDRSRGDVVINGKSTHMLVKPHRQNFSNILHLVYKASPKRFMNIDAHIAHTHFPGTMLLTDSSWQTSDYNVLQSYANVEYKKIYSRFSLSGSMGNSYKAFHNVVGNPLGDFNERYKFNRFNCAVQLEYSTKAFSAKISLPCVLTWQAYDSLNRYSTSMEPSLYTNYQPFAKWEFSAGYSWKRQPLHYLQTSQAYMFFSPSHARQGLGQLSQSHVHNIKASVTFKDAVNGLFASVHFNCTMQSHQALYRSKIENDIYCSSATHMFSSPRNYMVWGRLNQSFLDYGLTLGFSIMHFINHHEMLLGNQRVAFATKFSTLEFNCSAQPMSWLSIAEKSEWKISRQTGKQPAHGQGYRINYLAHHLTAHFTPKNWILSWSHDIYHGNRKYTTFNYFSDISAVYRMNGYELGLEMKNIFGKKKHEIQTISENMMVYSVTRLLPRLLMLRFSFSL